MEERYSENPPNLSQVRDLREFFYQLVPEAISQQAIEIPKDIEFYLVNLLSTFHHPERFAQFDSTRPLAVFLLSAAELPKDECRLQLKWLGDFTLFTVGYFSESLKRKLVGSDYYAALGTQAYSYLAAMMGSQVAETYHGLADHFLTCTDILHRISASTGHSSPDLLHWYEEWLSCQSQFAHEELAKRGIIPVNMSQKTKLYDQ